MKFSANQEIENSQWLLYFLKILNPRQWYHSQIIQNDLLGARSQLWMIGVIYFEQFCSPNFTTYQNHPLHSFYGPSCERLFGGFSNQGGEINFSDQVGRLLTVLDSEAGFMCGLLRTGILEQSYKMARARQSGNPPCYSFSYPNSPLIPPNKWCAGKCSRTSSPKHMQTCMHVYLLSIFKFQF